MTSKVPTDNTNPKGSLITPDQPEARISAASLDDEALAGFLQELDEDDAHAAPTAAAATAAGFDDANKETGFMLGEDEFDTFIPKQSSEKMKTLPEIIASLPNNTRQAPQIIADTLQSMPLEQRERIVRELYGIEKVEAEITATTNHVPQRLPITTKEQDSEEFLDGKLAEMDKELKRLKTANAWNLKLAALELAESQNLDYTQNRTFRLKFLRTDRFHPTRAAARFIRYFDWKMELFGEACLTRDITMNDLTKEDIACMKKGYLQRLPVRDRAGRAIFCIVYNGQQYYSPESMARQYFYVGATCADEETDKKGYIIVFFKIKNYTFKKCDKLLGACFYLARVSSDFPVRVDAYHKFLEPDASVMHKIVDYALGVINPEIRARTNVCYGKHADWMRELMSFGIPQDIIPFTQSYKIKTKNHLEYLSMLSIKEEILASDPPTSTPDKLIDLPTRRDVLLGKGKPIQFSCGNQRLSNIIDGYLDQYHEQSTKAQKTALAAQMVKLAKSNGVRFLSKESGIWMEVSDDMARDKVSHMFRHQRTKAGNKESTTSSDDSSTGTVRAAPNDTSEAKLHAEDPSSKRAKVEGGNKSTTSTSTTGTVRAAPNDTTEAKLNPEDPSSKKAKVQE